jgi:hypothetical protein
MPSKQDQWNRAVRNQQIADKKREKPDSGNKPVRHAEETVKKQGEPRYNG